MGPGCFSLGRGRLACVRVPHILGNLEKQLQGYMSSMSPLDIMQLGWLLNLMEMLTSTLPYLPYPSLAAEVEAENQDFQVLFQPEKHVLEAG